ncbi:MAG: hypothetical protein U0U46_08105 [Saprospiraceae bacterium]
MASIQYYPRLSTVVDLGNLPDQLSFIEGGLAPILDHIFVKEWQFLKSPQGDTRSYYLVLKIFKRLKVEVPGAFTLLLNPPALGDPNSSDIPCSFQFQLEILKYTQKFSLKNFSHDPKAFFRLILDILDIDPKELLAEVIRQFTGSNSTNEFIANVNAINGYTGTGNELSFSSASTSAQQIEDLLNDIIATGASLEELVYSVLHHPDLEEISKNNINSLFSKFMGGSPIDRIKKLLIPKVSAGVLLKPAIEFPRTVLIPIKPNGEVETDENIKSRLDFGQGEFSFSTEGGIGFDANITVSFNPAYPSAEIGNTGFTIGFQNAKLDISRETNIPEATADGRPNEFVGVYIQSATIGLPKKWFKDDPNHPNSGASIVGTNLIMGTGGVSGKIALVTTGNPFHQTIGKFELSLTTVAIELKQNAFVSSDIKGKIKINGFKDASNADAVIDVGIHIDNDGDFKLTASSTAGILLKIPGVLDFNVRSLSIGREDDRFFISTSGTITCTFTIPALTFDRPISFDMKELIIHDDGQIELKGGNIILPQALTLKIGPVKVSVTAISFGSYERDGRKYKYFGFDGGVNVNPGGVDVRASGVKVYFTVDSGPFDIFVRVEGIAIDLIIPGSKSADEATVLISGFLQVKEPDPSVPGSNAGTEYGGGISFKLPKAGIGGSAAMRMIPSLPAFIIDTELSLSVPLPLGNTSLGVYGGRGMIAMRYVADRAYPPLGLAADASWYEYYKKKVQLSYKEGITIDKFAQRKGFAIGLGVTIGTLTDSGKAFSAKLFLLLSLPDALLLQGQAAIMAERVDLSPNDPPFSVLIAITKQSIEAAFGIAYKLPADSGAILDLNALIEIGFFFQDSSAWYLNVGRDQPESKRVTARILSLFDAWSYLMLSASGIKAGAGASWEFNKGFGPVKIELKAYLDTQGRISFKPKQIGGAVHIGGSVAVKVFKFKLGLSASASLAAESPHPFIVTGTVQVCIDLPKPFKKYGGCFDLEFTWTRDPNVPTLPNPVFNEENVGEAAKAINVATRERLDLNVPAGAGAQNNPLPPPPSSGWTNGFDAHVVSLDSAIDIEFKKPIAPGSGTTNIGITGSGYNNVDIVPPQRGKSAQVYHAYTAEEVIIRSWNPLANQWERYDVYAALTPLQHASFVNPNDLIGLKEGWWQVDQPDKVNKLSLLSQTPLAYANDTTGNFVPENNGVTVETIFCPPDPIEKQCITFQAFPNLTIFPAGVRRTINNLQVLVVGQGGQVASILNPFGFQRGLVLKPQSQLQIFFPELTACVSLQLITLADDVTVSYQRRVQVGVNSSQQPVYDYQPVRQEVLLPVNTLKSIEYLAADAPIDRVVITAGKCKCTEVEPVPTTAPGVVTVLPPSDPDGGVVVPEASSVGLTNRIPGKCKCTEGHFPAPVIPGSSSTGLDPVPGPDFVAFHQDCCGSIAAWLCQVCYTAHQQLAQLQHQHDALVAQAQLLFELCRKYRGDPCNSHLGQIYCQQAQELLQQAAALNEQIAGLLEFIRCCDAFTKAGGSGAPDPAAEMTGSVETQANLAFPCGTDPAFNFKCTTVVFRLCWLPLRAQLFNDTLPSFQTVLNNNNAMVTAINNTIYPIWRPDTLYAVSIKLSDQVTASELGHNATTAKYMHLGFRTKGPIGHFHENRAEYQALKSADRGDQFRLQSLKPYIDFSKSYPNADGNILDAKPLFYVNPKLQLFYNQSYIYTMYGGGFDPYNGNAAVTSTLEVSILDPVNPLPADANDPAFVGPVALNFQANNLGQVPQDVAFLNNMVTQGEPCTHIANAITPPGIQSNATVDRLKPLKLYLAVYKANYNNVLKEAHRYNFQTSRYADFPEQVNSYQLKDRQGKYVKEAVFDDIPVTLDGTRTAQLIALLNHNYPAGDPLEQEYADPFDRLMDGILQTGPLDPPVGTDFNIVRDANNNNQVVGILLRNPEPFNDPKIPPAEISATITLSQNNGPVSAFTVIHSKDRSRAFIGSPLLNMAINDLKFTFKYLEYNGAAYMVASTVVVNLFVTPPFGNSTQ